MPPGVSRMILTAQEDLRREIARPDARRAGPEPDQHRPAGPDRGSPDDQAPGKAAGGGPASSSRWSSGRSTRRRRSSSTSGRWSSTTSASCRRCGARRRDRGRRAGIKVEFESVGVDHRLPVELESGLFRMLDDALAAHVAGKPDRLVAPPRLGRAPGHRAHRRQGPGRRRRPGAAAGGRRAAACPRRDGRGAPRGLPGGASRRPGSRACSRAARAGLAGDLLARPHPRRQGGDARRWCAPAPRSRAAAGRRRR